MSRKQHHRNCYQTRGVPQSLLDEGAPATLCDCKTLWMIDGFEFGRRTERITEWGIRIPGGAVLTVNTVPISDDVRDAQVKAMTASGIRGDLVSRARIHTADDVSEWVSATPVSSGEAAHMGGFTDAADTTGSYAVGNDQQGETT